MRMVRPANVSRAAALVTMGGRFTDKAGLTVACMSRPRNGDAPGKNGSSHDINDKNHPKQDEASGPRLTVPVIVRSEGISIDHHRQGGSGLFPPRAPELIAQGGKEERRGFASNAGEGQQYGRHNAAICGGDNDGGDGFPLAGAEGHGGFAQSVRNTAKKLFRATQGDRNHHQAEGESPSERGKMLERQDDKTIS